MPGSGAMAQLKDGEPGTTLAVTPDMTTKAGCAVTTGGTIT